MQRVIGLIVDRVLPPVNSSRHKRPLVIVQLIQIKGLSTAVTKLVIGGTMEGVVTAAGRRRNKR